MKTKLILANARFFTSVIIATLAITPTFAQGVTTLQPPHVVAKQDTIALSPLQQMETAMLASINKQREQQGLSPFVVRRELTLAARQLSNEMAKNNKLDHVDGNGHNAGDRVRANGYEDYLLLGENIAMNGGFDNPGEHAITGWLKSADHRSNIFNSDFTETGTGVAQIDGLYFFTQVFSVPTRNGLPTKASSSTGGTVVVPVVEDPNAPPAWATRMLALINNSRREHNLSEVTLSPKLSNAALAGSALLVQHAKQNPTGAFAVPSVPLRQRLSDANYPALVTVRENLAMGTDDIAQLIAMWVQRGGTAQANLLSPEVTEIGVGYSTDTGSQGRIDAWNILFASAPK